MHAAYLQPDVALAETGTVHAAFDLRNHSPDTWRSRDGSAVGYPKDLRGDGIYAVGRNTGRVKQRYPGWLYS